MLRTLHLLGTIQPVATRRQSLSRQQAHARPLIAIISYTLIAINAALLLSYFAGVNKYASSGYEIKNMQSKISQLTEENKRLTVKVSEQTSMNQLQNEIATNPSFVAAGTPRYIQVNQYSKK